MLTWLVTGESDTKVCFFPVDYLIFIILTQKAHFFTESTWFTECYFITHYHYTHFKSCWVCKSLSLSYARAKLSSTTMKYVEINYLNNNRIWVCPENCWLDRVESCVFVRSIATEYSKCPHFNPPDANVT